MAFNTWQPGIDQVQKIAQLRTNRFTYPADLENQARSAVIHLDYPAFTRCFQQFMEAGLREVHSPQEIREVCIRLLTL